jgi:uncharacterized metal-binding protein YceD (DUF177 family)
VPDKTFLVPLADLERGPKTLRVPLTETWLRGAFADTEATPLGDGTLDVSLTKTGEEVMVRGRAGARVTVPCVVTLDPLNFELTAEVFLLLYPERRGEKTGRKKRKDKPKSEEDRELSSEDAARDTYQGEEVVLDDFLREFLLLELPAYPRRSDLPSAEERISSRPLAGSEPSEKPLDPRLEPLLALAGRLKNKKE